MLAGTKIIIRCTYKERFSWKFSATSHGKGVVDGIGGRVKSIVYHRKVISLWRDQIIVQDARSFCQLASTLCDKTTVIHVMADEIDTYKSEDSFANSVQIKGIARMHVISSNGETTHLWLNSKNEKSLGNASAEIVVAGVATLTKDTKFSYHVVFKTSKANFIGFSAIVTETNDTNRVNEIDELEINYLKRSFGKWVINENNLDSREIKDLIRVRAHADGRS